MKVYGSVHNIDASFAFLEENRKEAFDFFYAVSDMSETALRRVSDVTLFQMGQGDEYLPFPIYETAHEALVWLRENFEIADGN